MKPFTIDKQFEYENQRREWRTLVDRSQAQVADRYRTRHARFMKDLFHFPSDLFTNYITRGLDL